MVVSRQQNHSLLVGNKSFGQVAKVMYLGTTVTNQHVIYEESKSRLSSGNTHDHSGQSFSILFSSLQTSILKYTKLHIYPLL